MLYHTRGRPGIALRYIPGSFAFYTAWKLRSALSESVRRLSEQRAAILDRQIDTAVYEPYDLTKEEIEIVEGDRTKVNAALCTEIVKSAK